MTVRHRSSRGAPQRLAPISTRSSRLRLPIQRHPAGPWKSRRHQQPNGGGTLLESAAILLRLADKAPGLKRTSSAYPSVLPTRIHQQPGRFGTRPARGRIPGCGVLWQSGFSRAQRGRCRTERATFPVRSHPPRLDVARMAEMRIFSFCPPRADLGWFRCFGSPAALIIVAPKENNLIGFHLTQPGYWIDRLLSIQPIPEKQTRKIFQGPT